MVNEAGVSSCCQRGWVGLGMTIYGCLGWSCPIQGVWEECLQKYYMWVFGRKQRKGTGVTSEHIFDVNENWKPSVRSFARMNSL